MTTDARIGECDACHARFKVPATFRADRARCRECGGVVVLERTHPVPRPPLEKSRKSKTVARPHARDERTMDEHSAPSAARADAREPQRTSEHTPTHGSEVAHSAAPRPLVEKPLVHKSTADKPASAKDRAATSKESKKSGGVLGSIVAAAKAAVWRKKRDGSKD